MTNIFTPVVSATQQAPKPQRPDTAISGICQQMTQSNLSGEQLGDQLQQVKGQLVTALQQS